MNTQPALSTNLMILDPVAVASRAIITRDWYYSFIEARLEMRGVVHH